MGMERPFADTALVMGVLSSLPDSHPQVFALLHSAFGPIMRVTKPMPFTFTDYYDEEMGTPIHRFFVLFERLVDPSSLPSVKLETNRLERMLAVDGKRRINLDPGLLSAGNLILATTKNRSHRIPLRDGIYGEVTLIYAKGEFRSLPWTYADYRSEPIRELFAGLRSEYLKRLRLNSAEH